MTKPAPLTPHDCDLTNYQYMPLEVARLHKSRQWLIAKRRPEIAFYAVNLWARAWHEVPAASLENDDDVLSDAAMCPPDRWLEVKDDVLRGFVLCSDGRLYHKTVSQIALESWAKSLEFSWRKECDRLRKEHKRRGLEGAPKTPELLDFIKQRAPQMVSRFDGSSDGQQSASAGNPAESALKGREGKGKEGNTNRGSAPKTPKEKISASAKTVFSEGWALGADAIAVANANGFGENETAQLAAEHREYVEANMPGAKRTAKAWGDLWRRRCETISADAKALAALRKRVARAKPNAPAPAIDLDWPAWWQRAALVLAEAHAAEWRSYWSQCVPVGPHQIRAATQTAFNRLRELAPKRADLLGVSIEILPPEKASTGKAAK